MIEQVREIYGAGVYTALIDGRPALVPKSARLGAYHQIRRAMADGQKVAVVPQVLLDAPLRVIAAGGLDEVTVAVEVRGAEGLERIDLLVEGLVETVALVEGKGVLGPLAAEEAGAVLIEAADKAVYHGEPLRLSAVVAGEKIKVTRADGRLVLGSKKD